MEVNEDVLKELAKNERTLWRRFGIRLRVDSVSADGSKLVCTASRVRWSIIHANMPSYEVVEHASAALACLRRAGVTALVGVVPKRQQPKFKRMDPRTPFGFSFLICPQRSSRSFGTFGAFQNMTSFWRHEARLEHRAQWQRKRREQQFRRPLSRL